jgi:hypothetical protein
MNKAFLFIALISLVMAGCTPAPTVLPTATPPPTAIPTDTLPPTAIPIASPTATVTPFPLPSLTLKPGDLYFSLDGKPVFLFSRNLAGNRPDDYAALVGMAHQQGDLLVRVGTDNAAMGGNSGYGYTATGEISSDWSKHWERFFDTAEADQVYVIPTFMGWINWNDTGYNTWAQNPFNSANGGSTKDPREIYKKDSPTQLLYLKWFRSVVTRWSAHKNILAWEVVTEINLINGISQPEGVYLTEQLARVVQEADPLHRPVTAAVADWSGWSQFLGSDAIDFINFHPYPPDGTLDHRILEQVPLMLKTYHKPVLIAESGLNAATPDSAAGKITLAPNARIGIQHAIWAQLVSGAMNGRALWWEDSFGIYFPGLGMPWVQKYTDVEAPVARFIAGVDVSGYTPIAARASGKVFGAALGNGQMIIGWYRDASCEPPNWNLQPVVSKQTVTLIVPGSAANWRVDFYSTKDGTTQLGSVFATRKGQTITIPLPDFQDAIAFKATGR